MRYRVNKDANQDLDEIFLYWAKRAGLKVADRLVDGIMDRSGCWENIPMPAALASISPPA